MAASNMSNYLVNQSERPVNQEDPLRAQDLQIPMWGDEEPARPIWDKENTNPRDFETMDLKNHKSSSNNYQVDHRFDFNQSPQQMVPGASEFTDLMPSAKHSEWNGPVDFTVQNDQFKSPEPSASSGAHGAFSVQFTPRHELMSHKPAASGTPRRSFHHTSSVNFQPRYQKLGNLPSTASEASSSAQHAPKAVEDHNMGFMFHNDQFMNNQPSSSGPHGASSEHYLQRTAMNSKTDFMTPNRPFIDHQQSSSRAPHPSFHQGSPDQKMAPSFMNPQMPSSGAYLNNWHMSHEPAASGAPRPSFKQQSPTNSQFGQMDRKHFNPQMPAPGASSSSHFNAPNLQYMNLDQQSSSGAPGPSFHQGSSTNFQFGQMDQKFMAPKHQHFNQQMPAPGPSSSLPNHFMPHQSPPSAAPNQFMMAPGASAVPDPNGINFSLRNADIWRYMNALSNEMMVTNAGRSIFPKLDIGIDNLDAMATYRLGTRLLLVNPNKYTYSLRQQKWTETERRRGDELPEQETNEVYSTPQSGFEIMEFGLKLNPISIYTIGNERRKISAMRKELTAEKLYRMQKDSAIQRQTKIRVYSQYKYIPLFTLYQQMVSGEFEAVATVQFPETEFITTSAYKNEEVKNWKIGQNPNTRKDYKHKI